MIGIDAYDNVEDLQKAHNDARAVAAALERARFDVTLALDPSNLDMATALSHFVARVGPGDEAAFFFAGHGVEIDGIWGGGSRRALSAFARSTNQSFDEATPKQEALEAVRAQTDQACL